MTGKMAGLENQYEVGIQGQHEKVSTSSHSILRSEGPWAGVREFKEVHFNEQGCKMHC